MADTRRSCVHPKASHTSPCSLTSDQNPRGHLLLWSPSRHHTDRTFIHTAALFHSVQRGTGQKKQCARAEARGVPGAQRIQHSAVEQSPSLGAHSVQVSTSRLFRRTHHPGTAGLRGEGLRGICICPCSPKRTIRGSRCEEDLMQPGELSRVKEHAPKGIGALTSIRPRTMCCQALRAINRAAFVKSRLTDGEVFHFSTEALPFCGTNSE